MPNLSHDSNMPTARPKRGPLAEEQRARKQARFLKAYRESGNIKYSCKKAAIDRSTYYAWRDSDEAFKAALSEAQEEADDTLEYAAYDRAVQGVPSYVVSQGKLVYEEFPVLDENGEQQRDELGRLIVKRGDPIIERKYSDSLLTTLLKARMPEKYKDRQQHEHTGDGGGPIQVHVFLPD